MESPIYFATNRKHKGRSRWQPTGYGTDFSSDGSENLRFGKITLQLDETKLQNLLKKNEGDGNALADYIKDQVEQGTILAFKEKIQQDAEARQTKKKLGSIEMFNEVQSIMQMGYDIVIYIHGYNVSWESAVAGAKALELVLNHTKSKISQKDVKVVLFTWPSDGNTLPFVSYKSDRTDANVSGAAVGRAVLKLRDFLLQMPRNEQEMCKQDMHLLCHSMGNFVLQNAVDRLIQFSTGRTLPKLFKYVFLCAPDVDDDVLEPDQPLGRLHESCKGITVYYSRDDTALYISDYTKGNPERLGTCGVSRPTHVHNKVSQLDCSDRVIEFVEHSYYLWGPVAADIRKTIDGVPQESNTRKRKLKENQPGSWILVK